LRPSAGDGRSVDAPRVFELLGGFAAASVTVGVQIKLYSHRVLGTSVKTATRRACCAVASSTVRVGGATVGSGATVPSRGKGFAPSDGVVLEGSAPVRDGRGCRARSGRPSYRSAVIPQQTKNVTSLLLSFDCCGAARRRGRCKQQDTNKHQNKQSTMEHRERGRFTLLLIAGLLRRVRAASRGRVAFPFSGIAPLYLSCGRNNETKRWRQGHMRIVRQPWITTRYSVGNAAKGTAQHEAAHETGRHENPTTKNPQSQNVAIRARRYSGGSPELAGAAACSRRGGDANCEGSACTKVCCLRIVRRRWRGQDRVLMCASLGRRRVNQRGGRNQTCGAPSAAVAAARQGVRPLRRRGPGRTRGAAPSSVTGGGTSVMDAVRDGRGGAT
jgi:hypothetical protein